MTAKMVFDRKNSSFPGPDFNPILNAKWPGHYRAKPVPVVIERLAKQIVTNDTVIFDDGKLMKVTAVKKNCLLREVTLIFEPGDVKKVAKYNSKISAIA